MSASSTSGNTDEIVQLETDIAAQRLQETENNKRIDYLLEQRADVEAELADRRQAAQALNDSIKEKLYRLMALRKTPATADADIVL